MVLIFAIFLLSSTTCLSGNSTQQINDNNDKEKLFYEKFEPQNRKNKESVSILLAVLTRYDDVKSSYYQQTIAEYKKRIKLHNEWIEQMSIDNKDLLASRTLCFHKIIEINDFADEITVKQQIKAKYLDVFNFDDDSVLQTPQFRTWLDNYVSSYLERGQSKAERDSLLVKAGKLTIEKAKSGSSKIFEWVIDYLFEGYESMNIPDGIILLSDYINSSEYSSPKKAQIETRIKGIKVLTVGSISPDITITDTNGNTFQFHKFKTSKPYKMLMFWSADCEHCQEMAIKFYPWYIESGASNFFDVIAISLDDTDTEIPKWEQVAASLPVWVHSRAKGGMRSREAEIFYIVSTPVFIFVESETNKILALPENPGEIIPLIKQ